MDKINKKGFTSLQYFLWLIAGSEISTLKKCPNDYNRHANIGLMIFITSLFAGLTGFIAGHTFAPDNYLAVSLFAIVWAFLIFSLDRSMVNSIKKNPTIHEKSIWGYFWPRLFLAVILAFFMSIPLDHIVFKERIEFQMNENNKNNWLKRQSDLNKGYGLTTDSLMISSYENTLAKLDDDLKNDCPIPEYKRLVIETNSLRNKLSKIPPSFPLFKDGKKIGSKKNQQYYNTLSEYNKKMKDARAFYDQWFNEIKNQIKYTDSIRRVTDSIYRANRDTVKNKANQYKKEIEEMNGFDTKFVTLFLMPNAGVQFLKWLLFLALLVIEILPTFLKLKTPIGQYDWEMYKQEKITEIETCLRIKNVEKEFNEIEDYRSKHEIELNKGIIDKVVEIEEKLANEMLIEWETKARIQMIENVKNAN